MANTIAYYGMATITATKSFIVQAPGTGKIKLFTAVINFVSDRVFVIVSNFHPSLIFVCKAEAYQNGALTW